MRLFLKLFVPLFFALPLALAGAIYLVVDSQPSLNRAGNYALEYRKGQANSRSE